MSRIARQHRHENGIAASQRGVARTPIWDTPGADPEAIFYERITQTAHGFEVGYPVYFNGTKWVGSQANAAVSAVYDGVISNVYNANAFDVCFDGMMPFSGITAGSFLYMSTMTPGALVASPPTGTLYAAPIMRGLIGGFARIFGYAPTTASAPYANILQIYSAETWTVPAGVTKVKLTVIGQGGPGGTAVFAVSPPSLTSGAGGGGAGAKIEMELAVTAGQTFIITQVGIGTNLLQSTIVTLPDGTSIAAASGSTPPTSGGYSGNQPAVGGPGGLIDYAHTTTTLPYVCTQGDAGSDAGLGAVTVVYNAIISANVVENVQSVGGAGGSGWQFPGGSAYGSGGQGGDGYSTGETTPENGLPGLVVLQY